MKENRRWFRPAVRRKCTLLVELSSFERREDSVRTKGGTDSESGRPQVHGHYVSVSSGTGKTHIALALGLAACQKGYRVRFTTAASLVHELMEAKDEKRLPRYQKQMAIHELLIVDELGFVPLSKSGAELLFEVFSQRYERTSTMVTSNLPFSEWTETLGSERLTGALLDRLTHHVHILEMNGESYRLKESKAQKSTRKANPQ